VFFLLLFWRSKKSNSPNFHCLWQLHSSKKLLLLFLHSNAKRKMKRNTISFWQLIDSSVSELQRTAEVGEVFFALLHQSEENLFEQQQKNFDEKKWEKLLL
jgi:hypothetical protein